MQDCGSPLNRDTVLDPRVRYVCQRCTACCRWPGDVRVGEDEVGRIAAFLGMEERGFIEQFTRLRSDRQGLSLRERENHECIMLDGDLCRIHEVKPGQCEGFPNRWNFPGWRELCKAVAVPAGNADVLNSPLLGGQAANDRPSDRREHIANCHTGDPPRCGFVAGR